MDEEQLQELFVSVGPVRITRMFGGQGIYSDGMIVAIVVDGELLLKADELTDPYFEAAGSTRWAYARTDRAPVKMPYWRLPDAAYDDPSEMAEWARRALDAARRSDNLKKKGVSKRSAQTPQPSPSQGRERPAAGSRAKFLSR